MFTYTQFMMFGKPLTSDIGAERMARTRMGAASETWCEYFFEAKDHDLNQLKANGINIGDLLMLKREDNAPDAKPHPG